MTLTTSCMTSVNRKSWYNLMPFVGTSKPHIHRQRPKTLLVMMILMSEMRIPISDAENANVFLSLAKLSWFHCGTDAYMILQNLFMCRFLILHAVIIVIAMDSLYLLFCIVIKYLSLYDNLSNLSTAVPLPVSLHWLFEILITPSLFALGAF